jgi:mannosyltransferase OCH1-like enzyme
MASTGPLFLSLRWKEWLKKGKGGNDGVVALRMEAIEESGYGFIRFFINVEGRSWQGPDEKYISWLERHWALDIILASLGVVCATWVLWETFWYVSKQVRMDGGLGVRMRKWDIEHGGSNGEKIK